MLSKTVVTIVIAAVICAAQVSAEYYWRPWTPGSPPDDAITGRDFRGNSYIVEAYAPNFGLFVGQAFVTQNYVNVSAMHANLTLMTQSSHSLKVLCSSDKDKLAWYPTNNANLGRELLSAIVNPVIGGLNAQDDLLYIGRYVSPNTRTVHFGSICRDFHLHYNYEKINYLQYNYEILVINRKCTD